MAYIDEVVEKNKRYLTQAQINALAEASRQYNAQNAANRASAQASAREQYDAGYRGLQNMGLAGAVGNVAKSGEVPRLQTQIRTPVDEYNQRLRDVENRRLDVLGNQFAQQTQAEEAARAAAQRAAAEAEQLRRAQMIAAAIASNVQTIKQTALQVGSPTREIKLNGDELEVNPRIVTKADVNKTSIEDVITRAAAQVVGVSSTPSISTTPQSAEKPSGYILNEEVHIQKGALDFIKTGLSSYDAKEDKQALDAAQKKVDALEEAMQTNSWDVPENVYQQAVAQRNALKLKVEDPDTYSLYAVANGDYDQKTKETAARTWVDKKFGIADENDSAQKLKYANQTYSRMMAEWEKSLPTDEQKHELYDDQHEQYENYKSLLDVIDDQNSTANDKARARASINAGPLNEREARAFVKKYEALINPQLPDNVQQAKYERDMAELRYKDPETWKAVQILQNKDILYSMAPEMVEEAAKTAAPFLMKQYGFKTPSMTDEEYEKEKSEIKGLRALYERWEMMEGDAGESLAEKELKEQYGLTPKEAKDRISKFDQERDARSAYKYYLPGLLTQAINQGEKPEKAANKEEGNSLYRAINDLPAIYQFYEPSTEEEQDRRMVRYMTQDQKNSYNAIYERDGIDAANQYYHDIIPFLNIQRAQQDEEFARKFADEYPVLADIHSIGGNMLWNIPAAAENLLTGVRGMFTEERPYYDVNSNWSFRSARPEAIRSERSLNILSNMGRSDWVNKVLNSAYQTGMSIADSAAVLPFALTGNSWAVYAIFSSSAGMSAYKDAISRGATQDQALTFGILCGAAESIFEELSLERLIHTNYAGRGALIKNILSQAGFEGSEELATGLANFLTDIYVMRDKSKYASDVQTYLSQGISQNSAEVKALLDQAKDIGLESVGGVISGGLFSLGGAVIHGMHYTKVGKQLRSNSDSMKRYSDLANLLGPETQQALNEYDANKTDRNAGKIVEAVNNAINELLETQQAEKTAKESAQESTQTGEATKENTQEVEKEAAPETGETVQTEESVRNQATDNATALAALLSGEKMNVATAEGVMEVLGAERLNKMGYNASNALAFASSYNSRLGEFNIQARSGELTPRLYSRAQMRQAVEREARKLAAPSDRVWKDPNIGYVVTDEGKRVRGLPGNLTAVSEEEQKKSNYAARTTVTSGGVTYQIAGMESREGLSNSQTLAAVKNNMSKEARGKAEFYEKISKALPGISFVVHDTMGMPDGSFDAKTGAIHVSLSGNQSALRVTAHELTHLMKEEAQKNPATQKAYDALRQAIIDEIGQKMFDRMMEQKADEYTRMGDPIDLSTPEGKAKAEDETIAELCERMLGNPDFVEKFCEEHTEEAKTLMDYILKIVNAIKSALKDMSNRDFGMSWSDRIEDAENVLNKWYNLLNTTLENIGAAREGEMTTKEDAQAETTAREGSQMEDRANPELYADEESVRAERKNSELQREIVSETKKGPYPAGYSSQAVDGVISKALDVLGTKDSYSAEDYEKLRARIGQSLPVVEEWLNDPENEQKQEAANERIRQVANEIVDAYRETEGATNDLADLQQDIPDVIGVSPNQMADIKSQYDKNGLFRLQGMISKALGRKVTLVGESNPQFKNASKMDQLFEELKEKYNLSDDQDFARDAQNLVDFIQGVRDASEGTTVTMTDYGAEAREQAFLDVQTALADALTEAAGEKAGVEYSLDTDKMRDNGVRFSAGDVDALRIKDQLKNNQEKLNAMEPVVSIKSDGKQGRTSSQMRDALIEFFASRKYGVDRQGFGRVLFNADALGTMARYIKTNAEFAAVKAAPSVVKRGIQIGYENNHKGRGVESYTFAAPVILNGERGNVAVVVQVTNKNKAHCARVLIPDGSGFDLNVAEKADQEARGPEKRAQQRMKSASIDTIAESKGKSNSSERNSLDTDYLRLAEKYKSGTATEADKQQLQQDVDHAAQAAGYTIKAWHGSRAIFTEFSNEKRGANTGTKASEQWFFAGDYDTANSYYPAGVMKELIKQYPSMYSQKDIDSMERRGIAGKLYPLYLKMANPLVVDVAGYDYESHKQSKDAMMEFVEQANREGRDGIILHNVRDNNLRPEAENSTVYMFRSSSQAKLADPVTYDDQGNIIPLSERFKPDNPDIRWSINTDALRENANVFTEIKPEALEKGIEQLRNLTPGKGLWALKDIGRFLDTVSGGDKELRDTLTDIFETPHRQALKNYADGVARMQQRVLDIGARAGVCDKKGNHFDSKKSAAIQNIGEGFSNTYTDLKVRIKDADAVTVRAYEPGTDKLVVSERDYTLPELRRAYGRDNADAVWTKVFDEAQKAKETGHKFAELEYGVNTRPYTLENLQSDFRDDWQKLYEASQEFRQMYDDYIDTMNRMLEQLYPNTSKYADVDKITKAIEEKEARLKTRKESEQARIDELNKRIGAKEAEMAGKRRKDTKAYRDLWDQKERLRRKVEEAEADLKEYEENIRDDLKVMGEQKAALQNAEKNGDSLSRMHRLEYREDYFHHFQEMASGVQNLKAIFTNSTDISPAIVGKSDTTKPKSRFAGWMQKRTGADYTADALNGMLKYGQLAEYKLAFDPLAAYLREANDKIRNLDKNETNRDNLIRYIDQWTNTILGKSHKIDRALVDSGVGMRSKMFKTLDWINSRVIQNTLLWNMRSALIQISNVTNAKSLVPNPLHWAGGLRSWALAARGNAEMQAIMNQSTFLASRYMDSLQLTDSALKSAKEFAGWMLGALDEISAKATWWAAYTQYQKNPNAPTIRNASRSYANAIEYADDVTRRTHAGRGIGELAPAMTSRVINLVAPFQVEVNNTYQLLKDNVRQKNYWGLLSTGVSVFLMNTVFEAIVGSTPLGFDFIRAIVDIVFGFADDDDDYDLTRAGQRLAGEFVGGLPYANQIVGLIGQDYAKKIIGEDTDVTRYGNTQIGVNAIINTLSGLSDIADAVKDGRNLITETNFISDIDDLLSLIMPMGGKQLARTAEGIKTVAQGYGSKVDKEGVEKVQFITEQDLAHYLHASLFGKWSLTEASEYFGEERLLPKLFGAYEGPKSSMGKLVDAKEYKAALETGIDGKDYFTLKYDLKEYTTQGGKRAEMMEHDYTPEQKAQLDALMIPSSDAEVKAEGAVVYQKNSDGEWKVKADYTSPAWFKISTLGSSQYQEAKGGEKNGLRPETYLTIYNNWKTIDAKDENGDTVRGLKKKRAKEYLDSLSLPASVYDYIWTVVFGYGK